MFDFLKSLTPDSIYEALILRQVKVAHVNEGVSASSMTALRRMTEYTAASAMRLTLKTALLTGTSTG